MYRQDVQGLHYHNNQIKLTIIERLPDLSCHIDEIGIDTQMFTTEWVLDLFSHIIPLNLYGQFLDNFLELGWKLLYNVIVEILKITQSEILKKLEWDETLVYIRNYVKDERRINWTKIITYAAKS